jgi:hypothetical protein
MGALPLGGAGAICGEATRDLAQFPIAPQEERGGQAAYFKNVGSPLAIIGAQMLAKGQVEAKGVVFPGIAYPAQPSSTSWPSLASRWIRRSKS